MIIETAQPASRAAWTLEPRGPVAYAELHELFVRAGFMPEDKARLVAGHRADVEATFARLQRGGPLLNWALARGDASTAVGYLSAIWCHRRTTMFQHLAGVPGLQTGGPLVVDLMEQTIAEPQFDFMKFYFLADNPYPARIYGSFGEKAGDGRTCTMKSVAHVVTTVDAAVGQPDEVQVRAAAGEDLDVLGEHLADHESPLARHAEDLSAFEWSLESLNRRYQRVGLFRQRHVLVATLRDRPVGFALADLSSPGLNLSEGLSAFRTDVLDEALADEDRIRGALVRAVQDVYRRAGRRLVLGLVDVADAPSYERLGLAVPAVSKCIVMHRSRFAAFRDHVGRLTRCRSRVTAGAQS